MTVHVPSPITDLLQQLHGHGYFRPQPGPLRERLLQAVAASLKGEGDGRLADPGLDLEVSIGRPDSDEQVALGVKVNFAGTPQAAELPLTELSSAALEDLAEYLGRLVEELAAQPKAAPVLPAAGAKLEGDYHEQAAAAARLKVTPQWLKSVVPCTEYTYDEIDGKKYIRDYYWSKELIERLVRIRSAKTTPEDVEFVASECCEGDQEWARDLIARLKSPNRGEQPAREQGQKAQDQQQGRPGQGKGGGQGQQSQGQQGQGQGQQGQAAAPGQAKQGERSRRSRHRRGQRDKDSRKQGAPGPKPPTGSGA